VHQLPAPHIALQGTVVPPLRRFAAGGCSFHLALADPFEGTSQVRWRRCQGLRPGWRLSAQGQLSQPEPPAHPLLGDGPARLARQGVFTVLKADAVEVLERQQSPLLQLRSQLAVRLTAAAGDPLGPLLAALVMGGAVVELDPGLKDDFRAAGLSHALAASGFHLSVLLGVVLSLAGRGPRSLHLSAGLIAVGLFVLLAGPQPSVLRAALMAAAALLSRSAVTRLSPLLVLLLCLGLLLLWQPAWLLHLGFQFSAAATAGLLITAPLLQRSLPAVMAVPLAACLWTLPFQLLHFGALPLYALPVNVVAAPLLSLLTLGAFASAASALLLPAMLPLLSWLLQWPAQLLLLLVSQAAALPFSQVVLGRPPLLLVGLLSVGLLPWLLGLPRHRHTGLLLLLIAGCWQWQRLSADQLLVLDVGDASLVLLRHRSRGALISSSASSTACATARRLQQGLGLPQLDWLVLLAPEPGATAAACWEQISATRAVLPHGQLQSPGLSYRSSSAQESGAQLQLGPQQWLLQRQSDSRLRAVQCHTTKTAPPSPVSTAGAPFNGARSGSRSGMRCATARSVAGMPPKQREGRRSPDS
jgi:competence protein ComEC